MPTFKKSKKNAQMTKPFNCCQTVSKKSIWQPWYSITNRIRVMDEEDEKMTQFFLSQMSNLLFRQLFTFCLLFLARTKKPFLLRLFFRLLIKMKPQIFRQILDNTVCIRNFDTFNFVIVVWVCD